MAYYKYDGSLAAETPGATTQQWGSNAGNSTLTGTAGPDLLNAAGANDLIIGGGGGDTVYLTGENVRIQETAGGAPNLLMTYNNLSLLDYPSFLNLNVGGQDDYAAGNSGDNIIIASGKRQELYGGAGQDVLVGNGDSDVFIVVKGAGNDAIYGFNPASDVVRLSAGYTSFAQVQQHMTQVGGDLKIDLGDGAGVVLRDTSASQLTAANFELALDTAKLGKITFHDEFNGPLSIWDSKYNPNGVWRPDYGYGGAQGLTSYVLNGNGEQQIYTSPYFRGHAGDFAETPFASNPDGTLSIIARPSSNPEIFGYHYTSGLITTHMSFAQTYGYFEMRAELPHNDGGWPAFWLLPADWSWPPELDVMETLTGDASLTHASVHSTLPGQGLSSGLVFVPPSADGYHTYGLLWTKTDLVWYVDGVESFHTATPADMNKPMFMLANLALGGWSGNVDPAQLPAEMKIDYIRAYALADGSSTVSLDTAHTGGGTLSPVVSSPLLSGGEPAAASGGVQAIDGTSGDDNLTGGDGASNKMRGGDGDDSLTGGTGFNDINGNKGDDHIVGRSHTGDWLLGGQGNDLVEAQQSDAHNVLNGNMGSDTLHGGSGGDTLRGGQGDDLIVGGTGNDWISGDRGNDTLTGGGGADIFHGASTGGVSVITDFNAAQGDRIQLDHGVTYTATQSGADVIVAFDSSELILKNVSQSSLSGSNWIFAV